MAILNKIKRKLVKLRLQPIRVFCLHHVSKRFDTESMCEGDWMEISDYNKEYYCLIKIKKYALNICLYHIFVVILWARMLTI